MTTNNQAQFLDLLFGTGAHTQRGIIRPETLGAYGVAFNYFRPTLHTFIVDVCTFKGAPIERAGQAEYAEQVDVVGYEFSSIQAADAFVQGLLNPMVTGGSK